ncbi:hypothetical protein Tco_0483304, partial [Tanacetum coccineum]
VRVELVVLEMGMIQQQWYDQVSVELKVQVSEKVKVQVRVKVKVQVRVNVKV